MSVALKLCFLCNLGLPSQESSIRKHVKLRMQLLYGMIALFVRKELLCSSIRRLLPNRANGEAVFEGSLFGTTNVEAILNQR